MVTWTKNLNSKLVNESKTELCLFYKKDHHPIQLRVGNEILTTKNTINVLGVIFDAKLQWAPHISHAISRANTALCAIKLIKKYFSKLELLGLLTSNFYSILFYNSEIWHIPSLKGNLKRMILRESSKGIRSCLTHSDPGISFINLHKNNNRAVPDQYMKYKHSLLLYSLYNDKEFSLDWVSLNMQHQFMNRSSLFSISQTNRLKVGNNILTNRLSLINGMIPLSWLNLSRDSFKIKCKEKFLLWQFSEQWCQTSCTEDLGQDTMGLSRDETCL